LLRVIEETSQWRGYSTMSVKERELNTTLLGEALVAAYVLIDKELAELDLMVIYSFYFFFLFPPFYVWLLLSINPRINLAVRVFVLLLLLHI
jgi:hypothetical protein